MKLQKEHLNILTKSMKVNNIVMAMFLLCILCSGCEEKIGMTTVEYCKYIQEHKAEFIKEKIYENLKFLCSLHHIMSFAIMVFRLAKAPMIVYTKSPKELYMRKWLFLRKMET